MNILLLGSGGREHALAWKIKQSNHIRQLYIAPGNAGTSKLGENVSLNQTNFTEIEKFVLTHNIKMVVVGNEEPLVKGIVDFFQNHRQLKHIPVIGPCAKGAELEGSKSFAKQFMQKYNIPTARHMAVSTQNKAEGEKFLEALSAPYVLKADGLAAGKGVLIIDTLNEAKKALSDILEGMFGAAGNIVVIEEYLEGIEVSMFILTDGINYKLLPEAKDYKRIGNNDTGSNTGGMGSVSPVDFVDETFKRKVIETIIDPTLLGLQAENISYQGFIFFGLMNVQGKPYVIEYNVRLGDPETESILLRIDADIVDLFNGVANKNLSSKEYNILKNAAVSVVCVAEGYPGDYPKGDIITGLESIQDSFVFHAGTAQADNQGIVTNGGRVLVVSSTAKTLAEAQKLTYSEIKKINYKTKQYRTDIGNDIIIHSSIQ